MENCTSTHFAAIQNDTDSADLQRELDALDYTSYKCNYSFSQKYRIQKRYYAETNGRLLQSRS